MRKIFYFKEKGFTLIEIITVIAILSIIGGIGVGSYLAYHRQTIIQSSADEIVAFLYKIQKRSIGQHENSQWGVRFHNPTGIGAPFYASFKGATYTAPIEQRFLDRALDFSFPADGQSVDIVFNRIDGRVSGGLSRRIKISLGQGERVKAIKVSPAGVVSQNNGEVGWWRFDEGTGSSAMDISGFNNMGTIIGATWAAAENCKRGRCLSFNGIDNRVSILDSSSMDITGAISIEAWVRSNISTATNFHGIVTKNEGGGASTLTWGLDWRSGNLLRGIISNGTSTQAIERAWSPVANQWYHIVFVADGTNLRLFIDGIPFGAPLLQVITPSATAHRVFIGRAWGDNMVWNGFIDNVRIYDRALSVSEIRELYEVTR